MNYKTNTLGGSPIFYEMVENETAELKKTMERELLTKFRIIKKIDLKMDENLGLDIVFSTKDNRFCQALVPNHFQVEISLEEIQVYFADRMGDNDFSSGFNHEFLEAKEPKLFIQLKQLELLRAPDLKTLIYNSIEDALKE